MNKTLIQLIAEFAIFLELADETEIPLEVAVKLQEQMAYRLQQLCADDKLEFIATLRIITEEEGFQQQRDLLERLPEELGLI